MRGNIVLIVSLVLCVDLIFAQEVKFDPEEATVAVGQTKSVRCYLEPATQADAQYIWYDNQGVEITSRSSSAPKYIRDARSSNTGMLLYIKVVDGDQGRYRCKVIVDKEEFEGHFQLNTYATITVSDCKGDQYGTKGEEGKVYCKATAGDVALYTYWERNGTMLDLTSGRYRVASTYMAINNITDADKGEYIYVAEPGDPGSLITIKRQIIYFDVYEVPVIEKPISSNESPIAGGDLILYCTAKAYPEVVFSWYKGDSAKELSDTGRIEIRRFGDQSQLQFNPVKKDDEGMYRCKASNAAGDAESTATIVVHTPPIIQEMRNKTETENNGAILTCDAYGDPRPRMEWVRVETGDRFAVGDQTSGKSVSTTDIGDIGNPGTQLRLEFNSVQHSDAGNYQCEALNAAGKDTKIVNLKVLFAPNFAEQPDGPFYNWRNNRDGHLPCVVIGNPLPVFQWFKVDKDKKETEITAGTPFFGITREEEASKFRVTSKLMITYNGQNDAETFGDFKCVARNSINVTSRVLTMDKAAAPGQPTVAKTLETATQLHLSLVASGVLGPPVTQFIATISKQGSTDTPRVVTVETEWRNWVDDLPTPRTTMIIDGLTPQTRYSITLKAINAAGEGAPVEMSHTTKAISIPHKVIVEGDVNSMYPSAILVKWTPPDDGGSQILNYTVAWRPVIVKNTTSAAGDFVFDRAIQGQVWQQKLGIKPGNNRYTITGLIPGTTYQVYVKAINSQGPSVAENKIIRTKDEEISETAMTKEALPPAGEVKGAGSGLSTGVIVGIVIAIFVVLFIIVDVTCYFKNNCGILMSIREKIAGTRDEGYSAAKTDDVENLAKKDQLEDAKSAEEGELAAEQDDPDEEKKAPLLSEEQTVETVDEGEKKTEEMEPEDKEVEKQQETIENKENEAAQEENKTEEKVDDEPEGEKKG